MKNSDFIPKETHRDIRLSYRHTHIVAPHFHYDVEMIFFLEGTMTLYYNNQEYTLNPGDVFLAAPNMIHGYKSKPYGVKSWLVIIDPSILQGPAAQLTDFAPLEPIWHDPEKKSIIWPMLQYAFDNRSKLDQNNFILMLSSVISLIVSELSLKNNTLKLRTEQKILHYCREHYREAITLQQLSEALNLSVSRISHIFSQTLNISFPQYINQMRLHEAAKLLETTDIKIINIANQVGFSTLRRFNIVFREFYGITPSQYRNKAIANTLIQKE